MTYAKIGKADWSLAKEKQNVFLLLLFFFFTCFCVLLPVYSLNTTQSQRSEDLESPVVSPSYLSDGADQELSI